jgi:hypothetical protein
MQQSSTDSTFLNSKDTTLITHHDVVYLLEHGRHCDTYSVFDKRVSYRLFSILKTCCTKVQYTQINATAVGLSITTGCLLLLCGLYMNDMPFQVTTTS